MIREIKPIRTFVAERHGCARHMGIYICPDCGEEFEGRRDRETVMTGRCRRCANKIGGKKRATHGHNNKNSRIHVIWANMKRRCINPQGAETEKYKGVSVCREWLSFEPFLEWAMGSGYADHLTLDRIDPHGDYEPGNCRWADYSVQAANRKITSKNKSGHVGISYSKGKWVAKVQWKKKQLYLGRFEDIEDAISARNTYLETHNLPHTRA